RDPVARIIAAAPEVGGENEGGAGGIELGDERVALVGVVGAAAAGSGLKGARARREVRRLSLPRHISVASDVDSNPIALVIAATAQISGVDESGAGGIELRHKAVVATAA